MQPVFIDKFIIGGIHTIEIAKAEMKQSKPTYSH